MEEAIEISRAFAQSNCAAAITINIVKDNTIDKYFACGESPRRMPHFGRLSLFEADTSKLGVLVQDFAVCENTADVCRAVRKMGDGKIPTECMSLDFASAARPHLKFEVTENALYQALNRAR